MEYLIYFKPSRELENIILKNKNVDSSGSGLHSTLVSFRTNEIDDYLDVYQKLAKINYPKFLTFTEKYGDYNYNLRVLVLNKTSKLMDLQKDISSKFCEFFTEEEKENYVLDYNPHITLQTNLSFFRIDNPDLIGVNFVVDKYYFAKKNEGIWQLVETFRS